jgi:pectate lyase
VALTLLNLFETLGEKDGKEFLDLVTTDLSSIGKYSYDGSDRSFVPLLVDGTMLSPDDSVEGVGYCGPRKLERVPADGMMFLVYAKVYRLTQDPFFWRMARDMAKGIGWGNVYSTTDERSANLSLRDSESAELVLPTNGGSLEDACALLGLLELHRATGQGIYLRLSLDLGEKLIDRYFAEGFFTENQLPEDGYVSINNSVPLALLHLAAMVEDKGTEPPVFYPGSTSFDPKVIIARQKRQAGKPG